MAKPHSTRDVHSLAEKWSFARRSPIAGLYRPWGAPSRFGDVVVLSFLLVQMLDGVFTYFGVRIWGPGIEVNPLVSSAVAFAGPGIGIAAAKLFASGLGMALHLRRIHTLVAALTAFYLAVAILPWVILFLT